MADTSKALKAGQKLRQLIQESSMTQEQCAERYSMDLRTLNRYINQGITKVATVEEMANIFDIDFIEFFR